MFGLGWNLTGLCVLPVLKLWKKNKAEICTACDTTKTDQILLWHPVTPAPLANIGLGSMPKALAKQTVFHPFLVRVWARRVGADGDMQLSWWLFFKPIPAPKRSEKALDDA